MKVFVYDKKTNKVIAIFEHVNDVHFDKTSGYLSIIDEYGGTHSYSRKIVKTRIYQN